MFQTTNQFRLHGRTMFTVNRECHGEYAQTHVFFLGTGGTIYKLEVLIRTLSINSDFNKELIN